MEQHWSGVTNLGYKREELSSSEFRADMQTE
jgi:hypothetical protein